MREEINAQGTPSQPPKETQFDEMAKAVFSELNQLEESVRKLSAKIGPVLKPVDTSENDPKGEIYPPMSSLEAFITEVKNYICAVRHDIYELNDRITL
jgi:hypothetical protein